MLQNCFYIIKYLHTDYAPKSLALRPIVLTSNCPSCCIQHSQPMIVGVMQLTYKIYAWFYLVYYAIEYKLSEN